MLLSACMIRGDSMSIHLASLVLSPSWQRERLLLVRATEAVRLCRELGYEELKHPLLRDYWGRSGPCNRAEISQFVARAQLTRVPISSLDDSQLLAFLQALINVKHLAVVREGAEGSNRNVSSLVRQRRLLRSIEQEARQGLSHEGRRYKLVADADLGRFPNRDSYEVADQDDAIRVLDALAKLARPSLAKLLGEARKLLTDDWRPPFRPDGLILLRRIVVVQATRAEQEGPKASSRGPVESGRPAVEEDPDDLDQACQASTLVGAASTGVPFCQECPPS